jgi:serine/threonine protein phosphatase PrpC
VSSADLMQGACASCGSAQISADGYCELCGNKARAERDHQELDLGMLTGVTDRGLRHHRNEDALAVAATGTPAGEAALAVVCDGISTSEQPDEASLSAVEAAIAAMRADLRSGATAAEALRVGVASADAAVRALAGESTNAPAATFVAAIVTAAAVTVCWVGDSRAYWLPAAGGGDALVLTKDDSLASELVSAGVLTEADAIASPHGHVVTRWLGADAAELDPHVCTFEPPGPGVVLLCSDGLWNYAPEASDLAELALPRAVSDLQGAAADLLTHALEAGGRDNITVVLIAYPPGQGDAAPLQRSTSP